MAVKMKVFLLLYIIISSVGFLRTYQLIRPVSSSHSLFKFKFDWTEPTIEVIKESFALLQKDKDFQFMIGAMNREAYKNLKWDESEYLAALIKNDVYRTDNYWETVFPKYERNKRDALAKGNLKKAEEIENNFWELQQLGFKKRLIYENSNFDYSDPNQFIENLNGFGHSMVNSLEDIDKSPEQLLAEFKKKKLKERVGWVKLLPSSLIPFYDYFFSLATFPSIRDLLKSICTGILFSYIALHTKGYRVAMVALFGMVVSGSLLLSRNMPTSNSRAPLSKDMLLNYSGPSLRTTVVLTLSFFFISTVLSVVYLSIAQGLQISFIDRISSSFATGLMSTSIANSFFEVYEEKSRPGWRWSKAVTGYTKEEIDKFIFEQQNSDYDGMDEYDFEYDPENEEEELEAKAIEDQRVFTDEEKESMKHYEEWEKMVEHSKLPPKEEFTTEDYELLGAKKEFFDEIPESYNPELVDAYMDSVSKTTWRHIKTANPRDMKKPIIGTKYFRESNPKWFKRLFMEPSPEGNMNKLKRKYGAYRKSMYRIDDQVVLQPCDGIKPEDMRNHESENEAGEDESVSEPFAESETNDDEANEGENDETNEGDNDGNDGNYGEQADNMDNSDTQETEDDELMEE